MRPFSRFINTLLHVGEDETATNTYSKKSAIIPILMPSMFIAGTNFIVYLLCFCSWRRNEWKAESDCSNRSDGFYCGNWVRLKIWSEGAALNLLMDSLYLAQHLHFREWKKESALIIWEIHQTTENPQSMLVVKKIGSGINQPPHQ